jgi:hypothetical protein
MLIRLARYFAVAFAVTVLPLCVEAQDMPLLDGNVELAQGQSLTADLARQAVSLGEVIHSPYSIEGDYRVHVYGPRPMYVSGFYWLDDHQLILNDIESTGTNDKSSVIKIWNLVDNSVIKYGQGSVGCFADGLIQRTNYHSGKSATAPGILQKGPLGQEKEFVLDKSIRVYDHRFECGDQPSAFTTQHVREHPDEFVIALRKEHGFLVRAKRTMFPDGRTNQIIDSSEIVLHRPGLEPKPIPVPSKNVVVAAYYPFVSAYVLYNFGIGVADIYILLTSGELRTIKPPPGMAGSNPALSRRGMLWVQGSVLPKADNGIYLSRGDLVRRIASENSHGAAVSPNGCRMAYTTTHVDFLGKITEPTLKVIDLCTGEK